MLSRIFLCEMWVKICIHLQSSGIRDHQRGDKTIIFVSHIWDEKVLKNYEKFAEF